MKTIGLVLPSASGYSETFFFNKIKGLQANGFTVVLFVNDDNTGVNDPSIKIKVAPKLSGSFVRVAVLSVYLLIRSLLFHFKVSTKLYNLDKRDGIGFKDRIKHIIGNVHIFSESLDWLHFGFGTMALGREHVAAAIGAKMAVSFRGFDIAIYPIKHPNCYEKLWKNLDKIHVISDDIKDLVYKHGFKDEAELVKITPAIDISFFENRKEVNLGKTIHFITIARLHWKKGLDYTLEALSMLKQQGIHFKYTIIGEGAEYERLKFTAFQLGLMDVVVFMGKLPHEQVKQELENADIYLQYSIQEGFCNSVLEAQAMGLLCVVSDAEGLSENVIDEQTGWVVPKRQPKLLVLKLVEIITLTKEKQETISKQAQAHVKQHFSLQQQQASFKLFYLIIC